MDFDDLSTIVRKEISRLLEPAAGELAIDPALVENFALRFSRIFESDAEIPEEIGGYRVEKVLGHGGMGAVLKARHPATGAPVALKIAPLAKPRLARALEEEVAALAEIRSPHVICVIDQGRTETLAWMASEFVEGQTLGRWISDRMLGDDFELGFDSTGASSVAAKQGEPRTWSSEAELRGIVGWCASLARALHAMHEQGLLHRDLKPDNILIGPENVPRLIDFGLARRKGETLEGALEGTLPYMSPEQANGSITELDAASDQYALAVTFHEVITGQRLVRGARQASIRQVAFSIPPALSMRCPGVPPELDAAFTRALQKDPALRFASCAEFAQELRAWSEGRNLTPPPQPSPRREGLALSFRFLIVATLALVSGLLLYSWWEQRAEERRYFEGIDAAMAAGDDEAALDLILAEEGSRADDGDWRGRLSLVAARLGPLRLNDLFANLAFTVGDPQLTGERGERAEEASRLLRHVHDEHFVIERALFLLLHESAATAIAFIESASDGRREGPLLMRLRAYAHHVAGDLEEAKLWRERSVPSSAGLAQQVIPVFDGLEAIGPKLQRERLQAWLTLDAKLREARGPNSDSLHFRDAVRARGLFSLGQFRACARVLDSMRLRPQERDESAGWLIMTAATDLVLSAGGGRAELMTRSVERTLAAVRLAPQAADGILALLLGVRASDRIAGARLTSWLVQVWASGGFDGACEPKRRSSTLAYLAQDAAYEGRWADAVALQRVLDPSPRPLMRCAEPEGLLRARIFAAWGSYYLALDRHPETQHRLSELGSITRADGLGVYASGSLPHYDFQSQSPWLNLMALAHRDAAMATRLRELLTSIDLEEAGDLELDEDVLARLAPELSIAVGPRLDAERHKASWRRLEKLIAELKTDTERDYLAEIAGDVALRARRRSPR